MAEVLDLTLVDNKPFVDKIIAAVDCGVVVNPAAAANMAEGAIVDGSGNSFYGAMKFNDGAPQKTNFHNYRLQRYGCKAADLFCSIPFRCCSAGSSYIASIVIFPSRAYFLQLKQG